MTLKTALLLCLVTLSGSLRAQVTDTGGYPPGRPGADSVAMTQPPARHSKHGYTITGKVVDAATGETLLSAPVFFPHTGFGVATDMAGNFRIEVDSLPADSLAVDVMGYSIAAKKLDRDAHSPHLVFSLQRAEQSLNEFVLHAGEDPAILLMREVIAHKPDNDPDKQTNYRCEAYNRLEADLEHITKSEFSKMPFLKNYSFIYNDLDSEDSKKPYLPLYLTETISDYYHRNSPKKQREFIKASMVKGVNNENVDKYLGTLHQSINVYHNFIPVLDKKFVSPICDQALFYYKFKIADTQAVFGHRVIHLRFRPRREGENCFTGDLYVVDSVYALQKITMLVPKSANVNWINDMSMSKEFAPVDSVWFCVKDSIYSEFTAYNSKILPAMIGRKTTTYHHIVLNSPATDSVLDDRHFKEEVIKSDSARKRSNEWWLANRPDSLSAKEQRIQKMTDSINSMKITTKYKNIITFLASGVKDIGPLQLGPYFYVYSNNSIEGARFRISLGTPRKMKNMHFTGFLAYGTRDLQYKYGFTGIWIMRRHPWTYLYGYYIHDIDQSTNYYNQVGSDNIFSDILRKPAIPWKLAFSDERRMEWFKEYFSGFSHRVILQYRDYTPYAPLPSAGIFYDNKGNPTTSVISAETGLELRYAYKEKYIEGLYLRSDLGSKYPIIDLQGTQGFKDVLNSGYAYQKVRLSIAEDINMPPFGHIYWNVFSGKYFGTLPYPLLEIHPGNDYYYYNPNAFEMMNSYEFISDQYAGVILEHTLGGGMFNYVPALKRMKLRQFWTAKGIIGSLSDANEQLNLNKGFPFRTLAGNPYLELGTGVANIFQVFRVDFDWRVAPAPLPTEVKSRYFGVYLSMVVQF